MRSMKLAAARPPRSCTRTCTIPPLPVPKTFLLSCPAFRMPFSITTLPRVYQRSLGRTRETRSRPWRLARIFSIICARGRYSKPRKLIASFQMLSDMKASSAVALNAVNKQSCTIPIQGAFLVLEMNWLETLHSSTSSASAWTVCGTWIFISSPSKSALYGDVAAKFIRNLENGSSLILCAIMDCL